MRILVFGATGGTGRQFIAQALERGHDLAAFVRHPQSWSDRDPRVGVVAGDATAAGTKIDAALEGRDAVVSALGRRMSFRSEGLMERSMRALVPAMERRGVKRLIVVSAFGVGDSRKEAPPIPRLMYATMLKDIFADKARAEALIRASTLEWTILHPVLLTDGPVTARYRAAEHLDLKGLPKISRADVAHFIVKELEAPAFVRKTVALAD